MIARTTIHHSIVLGHDFYGAVPGKEGLLVERNHLSEHCLGKLSIQVIGYQLAVLQYVVWRSLCYYIDVKSSLFQQLINDIQSKETCFSWIFMNGGVIQLIHLWYVQHGKRHDK